MNAETIAGNDDYKSRWLRYTTHRKTLLQHISGLRKNSNQTICILGAGTCADGAGGKLDPNKRRVSQFDINNLRIQDALGENDKGFLNPVTQPVSVSSWFGTVSMDKLGPEIHEPAIYSKALKLSGKKDGEFIQEVFVDYQYVGEMPNGKRVFSNPALGSRKNNAEIPEMIGLYTPNTVRYEYYDRNGNRLIPLHPDKTINGLPAPDANWVSGFAEPEPLK